MTTPETTRSPKGQSDGRRTRKMGSQRGREPRTGSRTAAKAESDDDGPYTGDDRSQAALAFVMDVLDKMEVDCDVELRRRRPRSRTRSSSRSTVATQAVSSERGQVLSALRYLDLVVNRRASTSGT